MILSSACQQWPADQPRPMPESVEAQPRLHHAMGHDLRTGERIIAAKLCFVERETLNNSKITHDPEFDRLSPGFTANMLMVQEAYAAGLRRIDMGFGNFDTKSRLTKRTHEVMAARIEMR